MKKSFADFIYSIFKAMIYALYLVAGICAFLVFAIGTLEAVCFYISNPQKFLYNAIHSLGIISLIVSAVWLYLWSKKNKA